MRILVVCLILCIVSLPYIDTQKLKAEENEKSGFVDPALLEIISVEFAADPYSKANYDPFVKVRVFNNSSQTITRAILDIKLTADYGKQKLLTERFIEIISGGMRPYTTAVWKFYPRGSSAMALKGLPRDAAISASVYKVFCPKQNSPWQYEHKFAYPKRHDMAY
ncbi:MAG: hypothetical protein EOM80_15275 [Erysipelotrichia bacterium]|nr:hypothetical protein [Erysipelotrichia bacterium]